MHNFSSLVEVYVAGAVRPHRARLIFTIKAVRTKMRRVAEAADKVYQLAVSEYERSVAAGIASLSDGPEEPSHEPSEWYDAVWAMREAYMDKAQKKRDEYAYRYRPFRTFNGDCMKDLHAFNMRHGRWPACLK